MASLFVLKTIALGVNGISIDFIAHARTLAATLILGTKKCGVIAMPFAYCTKALSARRLGLCCSQARHCGPAFTCWWPGQHKASSERVVVYVDDTTPPLFQVRN